ncbi:hypothetical protein MA16_Dca015505 [Dendrobium catenatum]|uniref:Uncharacterized protein n=1 Tax=Dendrobium catenatum TaxID=906689 RepID=A0A2I0X9S6_9ASPA|nr:hypothetical protein MA16_Dca015505 [Dendrobium catenatum]
MYEWNILRHNRKPKKLVDMQLPQSNNQTISKPLNKNITNFSERRKPASEMNLWSITLRKINR